MQLVGGDPAPGPGRRHRPGRAGRGLRTPGPARGSGQGAGAADRPGRRRIPSVQASGLRRLATLAEGKLADPGRAQRAWEELLRATPSDPQALEALSRHLRREEGLAHAGRRARAAHPAGGRQPGGGGPGAGTGAHLRGGAAHPQRGGGGAGADRRGAGPALPAGVRAAAAAGRGGRRLGAGGGGGREAAVPRGGLERQGRAGAGDRRAVARSPGRSTSGPWPPSSGRWRSIPAATEALAALAALYTQAGEWQRLILTDEKLLDQLVQGHPDAEQERWRLMFEIGDTADQRLGDPRTAFEWYRRAYNEGANPEALTRLEDVARAPPAVGRAGGGVRGGPGPGHRARGQVAIARKIAGIVEERAGGSRPGVLRCCGRRWRPSRRRPLCCPSWSGWPRRPTSGTGCWRSTPRWPAHRPRSRRTPGAAAQAGRGARAAS